VHYVFSVRQSGRGISLSAGARAVSGAGTQTADLDPGKALATAAPTAFGVVASGECSGCGAAKAKLALSERTYTCDACGLVLDRDRPAATRNCESEPSCPLTRNGQNMRSFI
jgi:Putative transposase DNA-binding domain